MPKTLGSRDMVSAMRLMISGKAFLPLGAFPEEPHERPDGSQLSRCEADVLRGICEGKSNKEIARDHDLQEVTVKLHIKTLGCKLGARNRTHAAMIARNNMMT